VLNGEARLPYEPPILQAGHVGAHALGWPTSTEPWRYRYLQVIHDGLQGRYPLRWNREKWFRLHLAMLTCRDCVPDFVRRTKRTFGL